MSADSDKMLRRCVSFVRATAGVGLPRSQVSVSLSSEKNRRVHPSAALEQTIEDVWATKLAQNPHLFNATKFRLASYALSPTALHMEWGLTDYKTYIGLCSRCDVVEKMKADGAASTHHDHTVFLSNKIGVAAALVTNDNMVCFLKRSNNVGAYPNMMDVPGGHPEPEAIQITSESMPSTRDGDEATNARCVDAFFDSIVAEIHEEVNVPRASLAAPRLLGVTLQGVAETPSFAFLVPCLLPSAAVRGLYAQGPQDQYETTQLVFQSLDNVTSRSVELTPSAAGCMELLQEFHAMQHTITSFCVARAKQCMQKRKIGIGEMIWLATRM
ncbi:Aste57867_10720 [Aphanomyces stellatus]|uniref:Aste57867_10720 protein n=1 Tax=Aphanomyces stellatus TaxID=120398 RepID=A0A485KRT6_9STRA|nr:hypothetical protein As57867_010680 [Aphanomyces stellatus]VFT87590.1 Aste57867_10720 [Aphanomyces stellatus]